MNHENALASPHPIGTAVPKHATTTAPGADAVGHVLCMNPHSLVPHNGQYRVEVEFHMLHEVEVYLGSGIRLLPLAVNAQSHNLVHETYNGLFNCQPNAGMPEAAFYLVVREGGVDNSITAGWIGNHDDFLRYRANQGGLGSYRWTFLSRRSGARLASITFFGVDPEDAAQFDHDEFIKIFGRTRD
jgi:hypothetical protein